MLSEMERTEMSGKSRRVSTVFELKALNKSSTFSSEKRAERTSEQVPHRPSTIDSPALLATQRVSMGFTKECYERRRRKGSVLGY